MTSPSKLCSTPRLAVPGVPGALVAALVAAIGLAAAGCGSAAEADAQAAAAPPPAGIVHESNGDRIQVDHPERFPVETAGSREASAELTVTGTVSPDVSRSVPVLSLVSGRVVALAARLGDRVEKGQPLIHIRSADASGAFADYHKAQADEVLADRQLARGKLLADHGALAAKDLEQLEDAADKAAVDVRAGADRLRLLGLDPEGAPTDEIVIKAPASGVITEQNVTDTSGVRTLDNSPNLFTIADLSRVWVLCDVYENDLPAVHEGDSAEIRLAADPSRVLTGRISNIGPVLDPATRAAKVRIELPNPGLLRIGMFVTATFHSRAATVRAVVPASAVLHLHDREWVYLSTTPGAFERREVKTGAALPGNLQEIASGLEPGARVARDALALQNTTEQ